jgi:hypothetical protein
MSHNPRAHWVIVAPGTEQTPADVARALLAIADPADVLTQSGGREFLVPPEVADAYNQPKTKTSSRRARKTERTES